MLNNTNIINALANKGFENVTATSVVKNGVTFEGFIYRPEGRKTGVTAYTDGCKNDSEAIARCATLFSKPIPDYDNVLDDFDKSKLIARIFAKGNSGSDIARPFLDLEICPYYVVSNDDDGISAFKLNSKLLDFTGMDVNSVIDTALANSFTDCTVNSIAEVLSELSGMPASTFDGVPLWVITNASKIGGAINLTNTDALSDLADKLDSDLYILPSSINEVLALPVNSGTPDILRQMVGEVNSTEVTAEEVLCENVYRYDRDTKTVAIA